MATYGSTLNATIESPDLTGNWADSSRYLKLTNVDNVNKIANWERVDADGTVTSTHGLRIHWDSTNNENVLYVNDDDNTSDPARFSHGTSAPNASSRVESGSIISNDVIYQWDNVATVEADPDAIWTVTNDHLWSVGSSGGNNPGPLSNNPKIENIVITKLSDTSLTVSFDWENLDSFTLTNSRGGVVQTGNGGLSGSSGTVNTTFLPSISCQEGDLCWVHGMYSNNTLEHHPTEYGSQSNPYLFKVVNFSTSGTALTLSTFLAGATSLNNDADLRVWDFSNDSWDRYGYINYDGTLQTVTIDPFERGKAYYVVDRSTGNDYGTRYTTPGGRKTRGRTFW